MTEPGDISDLVYADRYAWPGESLRIDTYRRVAIALAAREAGPERERHAALFLENSSPARSARGASWPMPAPQTATVTAGPLW